jgi:queuine tRNA-ribosyltransferase
MTEFGFEGFAIGGVAVGEPHEEMMLAIEASIPFLPEASPKHLLGVGTPFDIVQAVARGCDTFDCVIPTREARHGRLYVSTKGKGLRAKGEDSQTEGYSTINISNEQYKEDFSTIDEQCDCYLCLNHTKSYLRHLFATGEPLAIRLSSMHNLKFYLNLMAKIRKAITYEYFEDMVKYYKET